MLPDRLETSRLILRPLARGDALAVFAGYAQDPEVARYLSWRPHRRLAETEAYVSRAWRHHRRGCAPMRSSAVATAG